MDDGLLSLGTKKGWSRMNGIIRACKHGHKRRVEEMGDFFLKYGRCVLV